ncbi:hypothetical protein NHH73_14665 [Oxalobacteraceae bacterium OTU3CINTB1]|nr:hypothetical protein NHH73_14665 [Oxalobacteraceae bacterium OTU3CINTB1]
MAVWQSDLYLISGVEHLPDITLDGWLPPVLDQNRVLRAQQIVSGYLGPSWSVANDWFVFGPENGNRIDVIFSNGSTASIVARFDRRNDSVQFHGLVCRLAAELVCLLFSPDLNAIIEPDYKVLRMALADIQTDVTL